MILVIPTPTVHVPNLELSYALRISHDLDIYHKLDSEIIYDTEAVQRYQDGTLGLGNIVILDGPQKTSFGRWLLLLKLTAVNYDGGSLNLDGQILSDPTTGTLILHPHPTSPSSSVLFLSAEDESGLESIMRLFPIRTGLSVPDWVAVSPDAQLTGAAGVTRSGCVKSMFTNTTDIRDAAFGVTIGK